MGGTSTREDGFLELGNRVAWRTPGGIRIHPRYILNYGIMGGPVINDARRLFDEGSVTIKMQVGNDLVRGLPVVTNKNGIGTSTSEDVGLGQGGLDVHLIITTTQYQLRVHWFVQQFRGIQFKTVSHEPEPDIHRLHITEVGTIEILAVYRTVAQAQAL